jgi:hypothetical protein
MCHRTSYATKSGAARFPTPRRARALRSSQKAVTPTLGEIQHRAGPNGPGPPKGNAPVVGYYAEDEPSLAGRGLGHLTAAKGIVGKQPHVASAKRRPRRIRWEKRRGLQDGEEHRPKAHQARTQTP